MVDLPELAAKVKLNTGERKPVARHRPVGQTVAGVKEVIEGREVLRRGPRGGYACSVCGKPKSGHVCKMIEGRMVETQVDLDITKGIVAPESRGGTVMSSTARVNAPVSAIDIPLLPKNQRFRYPAPEQVRSLSLALQRGAAALFAALALCCGAGATALHLSVTPYTHSCHCSSAFVFAVVLRTRR